MKNRTNGRWWAVGALALSGVVIGVDATVLSLALPNLATDLHASTSQLQWFVDAYLLILGAMMLPAGLLGDRFGRKRLLLAALALVASAAMLAYPLGPILGGWLLTHYWWGSVFLINVPVIGLALLAVATLMPESRSATRARLDLLGVLLSTAGLVALTYGLIEAGERGWGNPAALAWMAGGAVVLAGFAGWERRLARSRTSQPLIDLGLFGSRSFTWGVVLATLLSFALIGLLFAAPQYFRAVLGVDPMGAGVRLLPLIGGMIVGLAAGDRISRKAGAKITVAVGFAAAAVGLAIGASTGIHDGSGFAVTWLAIAGFGTGVVLPAAMNAALSQLTGERSGVGSALISAVRQVGGTFGVAVLGSVLNSAYRSRLHLAGLPAQAADAVRDGVASGAAAAHELGSTAVLAMVQAAFVHGMDVLLAVSAGIAAVSVVLALVFLPDRAGPRPAPATPGRPAEDLPAPVLSP